MFSSLDLDDEDIEDQLDPDFKAQLKEYLVKKQRKDARNLSSISRSVRDYLALQKMKELFPEEKPKKSAAEIQALRDSRVMARAAFVSLNGKVKKPALVKYRNFSLGLGARVETMDPERHDRVLAITSHLPHLIAYNIVATAYDMERVDEQEVVKYSAGGFRDFTRIAASDPTMWRDVFLANKEAVLETLGRFSEDLAALQRAIRWEDGDALHREFTRARGIRKAIIDAGMDSAEVNFGRDRKPDPS